MDRKQLCWPIQANKVSPSDLTVEDRLSTKASLSQEYVIMVFPYRLHLHHIQIRRVSMVAYTAP